MSSRPLGAASWEGCTVPDVLQTGVCRSKPAAGDGPSAGWHRSTFRVETFFSLFAYELRLRIDFAITCTSEPNQPTDNFRSFVLASIFEAVSPGYQPPKTTATNAKQTVRVSFHFSLPFFVPFN